MSEEKVIVSATSNDNNEIDAVALFQSSKFEKLQKYFQSRRLAIMFFYEDEETRLSFKKESLDRLLEWGCGHAKFKEEKINPDWRSSTKELFMDILDALARLGDKQLFDVFEKMLEQKFISVNEFKNWILGSHFLDPKTLMMLMSRFYENADTKKIKNS